MDFVVFVCFFVTSAIGDLSLQTGPFRQLDSGGGIAGG